jgi:hypothetical protein
VLPQPISPTHLLAVIHQANAYSKCAPDFSFGECGVFAIALREFLGAGSYLIVSGSHYEMFDHVALQWGAHIWDGQGYFTPPQHGSSEYDEGTGEDYTLEVQQDWGHTEVNCQTIRRFTDPHASLATGASSELILALLRQAHLDVMSRESSTLGLCGGSPCHLSLHPGYSWLIRNLDEPRTSALHEVTYGGQPNPLTITISQGIISSVSPLPVGVSLTVTDYDQTTDCPNYLTNYS